MTFQLTAAAIGTGANGQSLLLGGQSALALIDTPAGRQVVTSNGIQGGLTARDASALAYCDAHVFGAGSGRAGASHLETTILAGRPALLSYGADAGVRLFWLDREAPLAAPERLSFGGANIQALVTLPGAGPAGSDLLVTSALQTGGMALWQRTANGTLSQLQQIAPGPGATGLDICDLAAVSHAGTAYVAAVSAGGNSLTLYRIAPTGRAEVADTLGLADGLGIAAPSQVSTVSLGGRSYVVMGASGSSSIVVAEVGAGGQLTVRDHVADTLETRFSGVTVLDSIVVSGRVFVVAGGSDAGITVMEMLPGGRLLHVATMADSTATTLARPSGLSLGISNGGLDIFVTSSSEEGVTRLRLSAGELTPARTTPDSGGTLTGGTGADLLIGGAGADTLSGGAGNDILVSGGGADRLSGGAGADLFVLSRAPGTTTTITDFQIGLDRLDLSRLGNIYTVEALSPRALSNGLELRSGDQVIRLLSDDGKPIPVGSLTPDRLFGLWHVPILSPEPVDNHLPGNDRGDILIGTAGADRITGTSQSDWIRGGAGNDLLIGDPGNSRFDTASAGVFRLYQAVFGRSPDLEGQQNWVGKILKGQMGLEGVAGYFTRSSEFQRKYGAASDAEFVTLLYQNVLGRSPDSEGQAFWLGKLAAGQTRSSVVLAFSESPEFAAKTVGPALHYTAEGIKAQWTDNVFRLYLAIFDRLPDHPGLAYWTDSLIEQRSMPQVIAWFLGSPEFQRSYGATSNAEFVSLLYRNVLDRAPDAAGLSFWTGRLAAGMSRAEVVLGFSESAEFARATRGTLISFMQQGGRRDVLEGGAGNDTLFGGYGADRFVFDKADGAGTDRVIGLEPWDEIELKGFGYTSAAQAMARFQMEGSDLVFRDQGVTITFPETDRSLLHAGMFLF